MWHRTLTRMGRRVIVRNQATKSHVRLVSRCSANTCIVCRMGLHFCLPKTWSKKCTKEVIFTYARTMHDPWAWVRLMKVS